MFQRFKTFLRIIRVTKNWISATLIRFGFKNDGYINFRNGYGFELNSKNWIEFMQRVNIFRVHPDAEIINNEAVKLKYKDRDIIYYFGQWGPNLAGEMFSKEPYRRFLGEFDITGKNVVDIGANAGDSAIYFALWGAKKVYAFEPFPGLYNLAEKNIKINGFSDICSVINAAVGGKAGSFIKDPTYDDLVSRDPTLDILFDGRPPDEKIPVITLSDIIERFKIDNGFLKVDCEGYEYDILLNTPKEILRHFDYIVVEYHHGFEDLKKKFLDSGFVTNHTKPECSYIERAKNHNFCVGYINARKV